MYNHILSMIIVFYMDVLKYTMVLYFPYCTLWNLILMQFTVPSCYVTTNCFGGLINRSISFSDCCANFGASFNFNGRCQRCPSTSKHFLLFYMHACICTYCMYTSTYIYVYIWVR